MNSEEMVGMEIENSVSFSRQRFNILSERGNGWNTIDHLSLIVRSRVDEGMLFFHLVLSLVAIASPIFYRKRCWRNMIYGGILNRKQKTERNVSSDE